MGEYLRRLRIGRAARQLAESETPLAEIALAAGFADQSHFSNVFRRQTGMSPSSFRRSVRTS
jgi:AraC family transcriptional regulator